MEKQTMIDRQEARSDVARIDPAADRCCTHMKKMSIIILFPVMTICGAFNPRRDLHFSLLI
jgi:hypothetical protein